jgi:flavin reductase (DIM6/NTAB) family NADH-FMN oxidoreductase RutF
MIKGDNSMAKIKIDPGPFVLPMPLALVGAEVEGKPNFMPAAFLGIVNFKPTIVACGLSPTHHTCNGISANGTFTLNLPGPELVEATDWCGIYSGKKKMKADVFEVFTGQLEKAPMIKACRLTAECKLVKTVAFKMDTVYFGEVAAAYVDDTALTDGAPDWRKVDPLIFTFPDKGYWKLGDFVAEAWSVGKNFK